MSRHGLAWTVVKFGVFACVMVLLTAGLFLTFSEFRSGSTTTYSALFDDVSSLSDGDSVRMAGVRVGNVESVTLLDDTRVRVKFDAETDVKLTAGTRAVVRYLNLVGDRYLALVDGPGQTQLLPPGSEIPVERTAPALDLELLLGGLKPVIRGLNAEDVNALSASLISIFQDQGQTMDSLMSQTASFTSSLADNSETVQAVIDNLRATLAVVAKDGDNFSTAIDRMESLVSGLAADRDPISEAIDSLATGTSAMADLLVEARPPLAATVDQLNRLAPLLEQDKDRLDTAIKLAPGNYRKLNRIGAYGSFVNYYMCSLAFRVSDLQGRTVEFPMFKQEGGRCGEP